MSDTPVRWDPEQDGIDHININPRATTKLGRLLADYTKTHFVHPVLGPFNSMIGYWHYVKAVSPDDSLRVLWGKAAARRGQELASKKLDNFRAIIFEGFYCKVTQSAEMKKLVMANELPYAMYYLYGPTNLPINPPSAPWLIPDLEKLSQLLKSGEEFTWLAPDAYSK